MSSGSKPQWIDLFCGWLPRTRPRSSSSPIPSSSPAIENSVSPEVIPTQVVLTPSIPLVMVGETAARESAVQGLSVPLATTATFTPTVAVGGAASPPQRLQVADLDPEGYAASGRTEGHRAAATTLKNILEGLQASLNDLPSLQLAVGGLLECIVHLQFEERNCQACEELTSDLARLATLLQNCIVESKPHSIPRSIENTVRAISEQTELIKARQDRLGPGRSVSAQDDEETILICYRQVVALFQQLQADISSSTWDATRELQMNDHLKNLQPVHAAHYDAALPSTSMKRVVCTKGTRVEILENIRTWARDGYSAKIYWMNGMAGTGKTTIAYTICGTLHRDKQLGASFFCSRNSPDCRDVTKIVPTIAYQLGRYSNPFRQALCDELNRDPDFGMRSISTQFEHLIAKPLTKVAKTIPKDVVIVIDALDECADVSGTRDVLNMLLQYADILPIKFFVASRPEPAISNRMTTSSGALRSILWLHDIEKSLVQADIKTYLTDALASVQTTPSELDQLAAQAGSLFIFAATAVRYIIPDDVVDPQERLRTILNIHSEHGSKRYQELDILYQTIYQKRLAETIWRIGKWKDGVVYFGQPSAQWNP